MTRSVLACLLLFAGCQPSPALAFNLEDERLANIIYQVEGKNKAKVPYGILSVPVSGVDEARRVCLNTIKNQRKRHAAHKCGLDFLACLANRYAPTKGATNDPTGLNSNWLRNVRAILKDSLT